MGNLIHDSLAEYFGMLLNTPLHEGACDPEGLLEILRRRMRDTRMEERIPLHQRLLLRKTSAILLSNYLENMPPTTVQALEHEIAGMLDADGVSVNLKGRADRIDFRPGGRVVLDYKTGTFLKLPLKTVWSDHELFIELEAWPEVPAPAETLPQLANGMKSLQLPVYLYCTWKTFKSTPWDAGAGGSGPPPPPPPPPETGQEKCMFSPKDDMEWRETVIHDRIPKALRFVIRHMRHSTEFAPLPDDHCAWCDFRKGCRKG